MTTTLLAKSFVLHLAFGMMISCATTTEPQKEASPNTSNKYVSIGNQFARDGLLREAINSYRKALKVDPSNSHIQRNLGMTLVKIGEYDAAITNLELAIQKYRNNFEANFYLAEAYRAKADFGKAIYRYNRALEKKPKSLKALKALAWSYYMVRFYSEAIKVAQLIEEQAPDDPQGTIIAARTYLKIGNLQLALSKIRRAQALSHKSNLPFLRSVEGDIYFKMGDMAKSEEIYRAALKDQPLLAGALLGLAKCLYKQNQKTELAVEYMERAVRIKPGLKEGLYLLGKHYESKDPAKSDKYYESLRKFAATDPEYLDQLFEVRNYGKNENRTTPSNNQPNALENQL